jgi:hypothetical protein
MPDEITPDPVADATSTTTSAEELKLPEGATIEQMWKENKDLRKENAATRTRAKEFEDTFSAYTPEQQKEWLRIVGNFAVDQKTTAAELRSLADEILQEQEDAGIEKGDPEFLTKAEVAKMLKEQEEMTAQSIAVQREQAAIEAHAEKLGYTPNSKDLETRLEYEELVRVAMTLPDYDLAEADKLLKARDQKKIDKYLEAKRKDAQGTPQAPVAGGSAPSQERSDKVKTWDDVEERVTARVRGLTS